MEQNGWLKVLLENMQADIDEIKADMKLVVMHEIEPLKKWKWKVAGGVTVICALITLIINVFGILYRNH